MMNFLPRLLASLLVVTLSGGCAYVRGHGGDEPQAPRETVTVAHAQSDLEAQIASLASVAETLPQLPLASQRAELEAAARDYVRDGGTMKRLRLALMLTFVDQELQNLKRAGELLAEPVSVPEHPAGYELSRLLSLLVAEMQSAQVRRDGLIAQQATQCASLQERLDRLKDIEKQINERAQISRLPMDDD